MVEGELASELEPIAERLHHVAWVHGMSLHLEAPESIKAAARGGGTRIASFDGLNLSGDHPYEKFEFSDGGSLDFQRGIGVSVKALLFEDSTEGSTPEMPSATFRSAGAEFVVKPGIGL